MRMKALSSPDESNILSYLLFNKLDSLIEVLESKISKNVFDCTLARILALSYYFVGRYEEALNVIDRCIGFLKSTKKNKKKRDVPIKDFYLLKILTLSSLGELESIPKLVMDYLGESLFVCPIDLQESLNMDLGLEKIIMLEDEGEWLKIKRWLLKIEGGNQVEESTLWIKRKLIDILYNVARNSTNTIKAKALAIIGTLASEIGRVDLGLKLAKQAYNMAPNDIEIRLLLSKILYLSGKEQEAYLSYKKLTEEESNLKYLAYLNMAVILARNNQFEDAIKMINKAIKLNISSNLAWYIRARILFESERFQEAEKAFRALLMIDPKNAKIHQWLGKTYLALGKIDKAVEHLSKSKTVIGEADELDFLITLAKNYK